MVFRFSAATLLLATLVASSVVAQQPDPRRGRIAGRVVDESGAAIPGAQVGIAASGGPNVTTGSDGRYLLTNVPAGPVALAVRAIGFAPKTVSGIVVPAGGGFELNVVLTPQTLEVEGITVSATAERGTVAAALDEQRSAAGVINAVTSEQIARSPDSDAGQAVQRVSGVTVQDGRYVFVRGLGERYTTTALNGARIPSPEPERRAVPLDLFPAGLLQDVTTTKTFTPDQPGDFTGAAVNLRTREFPLRRAFSFGFSTGYNPAVTARSVPRAPTVGREWLGYAGAARAIPTSAASAPRDFSGLTPQQVSGIIGDFRNVWSASRGTGAPNTGVSTSVGGEDYVLGVPLGYIASFSYSTGSEIRRDEERAQGIAGATPGTALAQNVYRGETSSSTVLWGGLVNLSARLGSTTKLGFGNTFSRTADNAATRLLGHWEEFDIDADITRLEFTERSVRSNQLTGEHLLGLRHLLQWNVTSSAVRRYQPDRSDLIYDVSPGRNEWFGNNDAGVRTFADLHESALTLNGSYALALGASRRGQVKVGGGTRRTERDADSRAYQIINANLSSEERSVPPEQVFSRPDDLYAIPDAQVGQYTAEERVSSGFVQVELAVAERLRVVGGARVEAWALDLVSGTRAGVADSTRRRNADVLPALALTYRVSDRNTVRVSGSRTLSRPEYREMALVTTRDIAGGLDAFGNPALRRALVQNYDARWEFYPTPGEVLSIGVFAKRFDHPIERVLVGTTGGSLNTWVNARSATNYGVELELRRNLGALARALVPLTVFANATVMNSRIDIGNDSISSLANPRRPMVGQAPYVLNAGLGYSSTSGDLSATLLYNVVGRRIHEAATVGLPDSYEQSRQILDLALRFPVVADISGKLDLKNLLDAPVHITQGDVTRLRYWSGRQFSLGLSWQP